MSPPVPPPGAQPRGLLPSPPHSRAVVRRLLEGSLWPRTPMGRKLALIALVDSLGSGMFYAGSALYFTTVVGLSEAQVGFGLSAAGLMGFLAAVPIGMAADRFRAGRVYVALQLWRGLWYGVYCFTGDFTTFLIAACGIGLADTAVPPINMAVVGAAVSEDERVDTLAKIRAMRNVGFGGGAIVATAAIQQGTDLAFVTLIAGNAVSFGAAALLLWIAGATRFVTVGTAQGKRPRLVADARYIAAAGLHGLLSVHLTLLPLALPLWIAGYTDVPVALFGVLYTLNTIIAVTLQAYFARPARTLPGAVRCGTWAGLALAAFGVAMHLMAGVSLLWVAIGLAFAAAILMTFGELWQSASAWSIQYELARPEKRSQYLSTFQLGTSLQAIAAPLIITRLVLPASAGWLVFAVVLAAAGMALRPVVAARPAPAAGSQGGV